MADTSYNTQDGKGTLVPFSTTLDAEGNRVGSTCVTDPASGLKQSVAQPQTADANSLSAVNAAIAAAIEMVFNGTTFDRKRGNVDLPAVLTVTNASGNANSPDQTNYNHRGLQLGINISAATGTSPTFQVTIQGKDPASGTYYTLLQSAELTTAGFTLLTVYPGAPATANISANAPLPRTWRISIVIGGTSPSFSASIGASLIV